MSAGYLQLVQLFQQRQRLIANEFSHIEAVFSCFVMFSIPFGKFSAKPAGPKRFLLCPVLLSICPLQPEFALIIVLAAFFFQMFYLPTSG